MAFDYWCLLVGWLYNRGYSPKWTASWFYGIWHRPHFYCQGRTSLTLPISRQDISDISRQFGSDRSGWARSEVSIWACSMLKKDLLENWMLREPGKRGQHECKHETVERCPNPVTLTYLINTFSVFLNFAFSFAFRLALALAQVYPLGNSTWRT